MTTTVEDVPFPNMPTPDPLWAIQAGGDLMPMPSRWAAELHKELCDELDAKMRAKGGTWLNNATLVRWSGTSAEHAELMARQEQA